MLRHKAALMTLKEDQWAIYSKWCKRRIVKSKTNNKKVFCQLGSELLFVGPFFFLLGLMWLLIEVGGILCHIDTSFSIYYIWELCFCFKLYAFFNLNGLVVSRRKFCLTESILRLATVGGNILKKHSTCREPNFFLIYRTLILKDKFKM